MTDSGDRERPKAQSGITTLRLADKMVLNARAHFWQVFIAFGVGYVVTFTLLQSVNANLIRQVVFSQLPADLQSPGQEGPVPAAYLLLYRKLAIVGGLGGVLFIVVTHSQEVLRHWTWYPTTARERVWSLLVGGLFVAGMITGQAMLTPLLLYLWNGLKLADVPIYSYSIITWLEFILIFLPTAGIASILPVVVSGPVGDGWISVVTLRETWQYAAVAIVALGAVLTPSGVFTQLAWAIPVFLLYVSSIALVTGLTALHPRMIGTKN